MYGSIVSLRRGRRRCVGQRREVFVAALEECSGGTIAPVSQSISVDPPSSGYLYRFVSAVLV